MTSGTCAVAHSAWVASDWIASPEDAKRQVEALWIQAIQRLNPGVGADEVLTRDRRIEVPEKHGAGRAILDELKDRLKKANLPGEQFGTNI
jgi:hypothetical protein